MLAKLGLTLAGSKQQTISSHAIDLAFHVKSSYASFLFPEMYLTTKVCQSHCSNIAISLIQSRNVGDCWVTAGTRRGVGSGQMDTYAHITASILLNI